ncbi:MAG: hypothetical protein AAF639_21375 [Chloroflexota bacterium]
MAYADFKTFDQLKENFSITIESDHPFFTDTPTVEPSILLQEILKENVPLALNINTEKARSELIIMQVLVEVRKRQNHRISLFSGIDFTVDSDVGLNGYCDFIVSQSPNQLFITAPVVCMAEAKNESLRMAYPQCIAEMIAAQRYNAAHGQDIETIWGVATNGHDWRFLSLVGTQVRIDYHQYSIGQVGQLLGIFEYILGNDVSNIDKKDIYDGEKEGSGSI